MLSPLGLVSINLIYNFIYIILLTLFIFWHFLCGCNSTTVLLICHCRSNPSCLRTDVQTAGSDPSCLHTHRVCPPLKLCRHRKMTHTLGENFVYTRVYKKLCPHHVIATDLKTSGKYFFLTKKEALITNLGPVRYVDGDLT